jgi:hypothetical protein
MKVKNVGTKKRSAEQVRKDEGVEGLKKITMLVVTPSDRFFDFTVAIKDRDVIALGDWTKVGRNKKDALIDTTAGETLRAFDQVETNGDWVMNSPIPLWAFLLARKFGILSVKDSLRFTTSTTILNILKKNKGEEKCRKLIKKRFKYLILAEEYQAETEGATEATGIKGYETILEFCSKLSTACQVNVFPPLKLLYFLRNKHELRDPPLESVKLPHVLVEAKKTFTETAKMAVAALSEKCGTRNLDFIVVKLNNSCAGVDVFFLDKSGGKWITTKNRVTIHDEMGKGNNHIRVGTSMDFEPFCEGYKNGEWRLFNYSRNWNLNKGLTPIYAVRTTKDDMGRFLIVSEPRDKPYDDNNNNKRDMTSKINKLCATTLALLMGQNHSPWKSIRNLVFRFDIVEEDAQVFLNEIDIFPVAHTFLEVYHSPTQQNAYIDALVTSTYNYFIDHTASDKSWPG